MDGLKTESVEKIIHFFEKDFNAEQAFRLEKALRKAQFSEKVKILYSKSNSDLGAEICRELNIKRIDGTIDFWANSEVRILLQESVKGCYCFVVGSYHGNANIRQMENTQQIRTCKSCGADKVISINPFLGYGKQEKQKIGRECIAAALIAQQICDAGADREVVIDLHAEASQGFFTIPVDHLRTLKLMINKIKQEPDFDPDNSVGISPDAGGFPRVKKFSDIIHSRSGILFKHRKTPESVEALAFLGDVRGKHAYVIDDMVQSGGSIVEAVITLVKKQASKITICITHGDWCAGAVRNMKLLLKSGAVDKFYITNTTPLPKSLKKLPNIVVVSVAPLLAEVIKCIYMGDTLSPLFELYDDGDGENKHTKKMPSEDRLKEVLNKYRGHEVDIKSILA